MFSAYQAGAWKALAAICHPDIVVGASAGALNAWAIAGGSAPEELIESWLEPECAELARIHLSSRGIFRPEPLYSRIERLWKAFRPQVEVGVVAVELRALRLRLFRNDEITWRHLAASCAVLAGYPQVRLGTKLYTDGGLLSTLPLWAAAEMGAERIMAINALPQLPSRAIRAAVWGVRRLAPRPQPAVPRLPVRIISPSAPLGSLREAVFWKETAVKRWIELGVADAGLAARDGGLWP